MGPITLIMTSEWQGDLSSSLILFTPYGIHNLMRNRINIVSSQLENSFLQAITNQSFHWSVQIVKIHIAYLSVSSGGTEMYLKFHQTFPTSPKQELYIKYFSLTDEMHEWHYDKRVIDCYPLTVPSLSATRIC